jgi:glutamine synthetase
LETYTKEDILKCIKVNKVEYVALHFTDTCGRDQHITIIADAVDDTFFNSGKAFDGSSFAGWQGIEASDMMLIPDINTYFLDPFRKRPTYDYTLHCF